MRKLLSTAQTLSILVTLLVSLFYPKHLILFFCLMAVRGVLENVSKSGASVALKLYMPTALLERASSYYDTNRYVSSATASLVGVLLLSKMSIAQVSLISALSFLAAAVFYRCLPYLRAVDARQPRPSLSYWRETLAILRRKPELRRCFINLSLMTGAFQGFYYIARSTLPIGQLGLSIGTAAFVQALISLTFTGGAMFVARFLMDGSPLNRVVSPVLQVMLGAAFMMGSVLTRQPFVSIGCFLACLFWYEVFYTRTNNKVMLECSPAEISYISSAKYGALTFSMLLVIVACGGLADRIGFSHMTQVLSIVIALAYVAVNVRNSRALS